MSEKNKNVTLCLLLLAITSACFGQQDAPAYASDNLKIEAWGNHVFVHISYLSTNDFGKVDCNGMVYVQGDEAIIFDTPTNDQAATELINWVQVNQNKKIKAVVVTHFHDDCLGGLAPFHASGIKSYANHATITLAKKANVKTLPESGFATRMEFTIGDKMVLAAFYGAGHTEDNVVGYIPNEKALFGGCLIKSMKASQGYLGDANLAAWPETVKSIRKDLPDAKIVIPGHGKPGGTELLDYTIELFEKK